MPGRRSRKWPAQPPPALAMEAAEPPKVEGTKWEVRHHEPSGQFDRSQPCWLHLENYSVGYTFSSKDEDPHYGQILNTIRIPKECSEATAIHEGVHAYDDMYDIFLSPWAPYNHWYFGGSNPVEQSEGLAYAMEGLLGESGFVRGLLRFESKLASGRFKSEVELQFEWQLLWLNHPLGRTPVLVDGAPNRKVNQADMEAVRQIFGIDTDPVLLTNLYNELLRHSGYDVFLQLPDKSLVNGLRERDYLDKNLGMWCEVYGK